MFGKRRIIAQSFKPIEKGFKVAGTALVGGRGHNHPPGMDYVNKFSTPDSNGQNRTQSGDYRTNITNFMDSILHRGGLDVSGFYFSSNVVRWKTFFLSKILRYRDCYLWITTGDRPAFNIEDMEEWVMVEGHREMVVKDNWRGRGGEMKWGSLLRMKEQREARFSKESGLVMDMLLHAVDHDVLSLMRMDTEFCARFGASDISYIFRLACRCATSTSGTSTQLDIYSLSSLSIVGDDYVTYLTTFHDTWSRIEQEGWNWDELMERWLVAKLTLDAKEAGKSQWPLIGRLADRLITGEGRPSHQEILEQWTRTVDNLESFEFCSEEKVNRGVATQDKCRHMVNDVDGTDAHSTRHGSASTRAARSVSDNIDDSDVVFDEENRQVCPDLKLRTAADWEEWNDAFVCWLGKYSNCRKWLRDGEKPTYEVDEVVPMADENGRVVVEAGAPVMVPNPLYVGEDGWEARSEDLEACKERTDELGRQAALAIGKIWSTASKRLQTKIRRQRGYHAALESGDLLWYYNAVKVTFDSSKRLVIEGRPVQSVFSLMERLMKLRIEGSGSQALYTYTSQFDSIWNTVLRLGLTSENIAKSWRNVCLVRPIWTHPRFERAATDNILEEQWPQLEQLLTKLSLTCGELLDVDRHVEHLLSKVPVRRVSGRHRKHYQATCHRCGGVGHIKRNCDSAQLDVRSKTQEVSSDSGGRSNKDDDNEGGSDEYTMGHHVEDENRRRVGGGRSRRGSDSIDNSTGGGGGSDNGRRRVSFSDSHRGGDDDARNADGSDNDSGKWRVSDGDKRRISDDDKWRVSDGDNRRVSDGDKRRVNDGDKQRVSDGNDRRVSDGDKRRVGEGDKRRVGDGDMRRVGDGDSIGDGEKRRVSDGDKRRISDGDKRRISDGDNQRVNDGGKQRVSNGDDRRVSDGDKWRVGEGDKRRVGDGDKRRVSDGDSIGDGEKRRVSDGDSSGDGDKWRVGDGDSSSDTDGRQRSIGGIIEDGNHGNVKSGHKSKSKSVTSAPGFVKPLFVGHKTALRSGAGNNSTMAEGERESRRGVHKVHVPEIGPSGNGSANGEQQASSDGSKDGSDDNRGKPLEGRENIDDGSASNASKGDSGAMRQPAVGNVQDTNDEDPQDAMAIRRRRSGDRRWKHTAQAILGSLRSRFWKSPQTTAEAEGPNPKGGSPVVAEKKRDLIEAHPVRLSDENSDGGSSDDSDGSDFVRAFMTSTRTSPNPSTQKIFRLSERIEGVQPRRIGIATADTVYIDTCADNHLWNHTTSLFGIKPAVKVSARGFTGNEEIVDLVGHHPVLGRVYVAHWATTSLISVPRLIDMGCSMICEGDKCEIRDKQGLLLLAATRDRTGMYGCTVKVIEDIGEHLKRAEIMHGMLATDSVSLRCYMVTTEHSYDDGTCANKTEGPDMKVDFLRGEYGHAAGLGVYRYLLNPRCTHDESQSGNVNEPESSAAGVSTCMPTSPHATRPQPAPVSTPYNPHIVHLASIPSSALKCVPVPILGPTANIVNCTTTKCMSHDTRCMSHDAIMSIHANQKGADTTMQLEGVHTTVRDELNDDNCFNKESLEFTRRILRKSSWKVQEYSTERLMVERNPWDSKEQSEALIDSVIDACADVSHPPVDSWGQLMVATRAGWKQLNRRPLKWSLVKSQQQFRKRSKPWAEHEDSDALNEEEMLENPLGGY